MANGRVAIIEYSVNMPNIEQILDETGAYAGYKDKARDEEVTIIGRMTKDM